MKKDLVKKIFYKYLSEFLMKEKEIELKSKSVPGPDFKIEGNGYECKSSKFDKKKLFQQLISFTKECTQLDLVLPYSSLNFSLIHKLQAIEQLIRRKEYPTIERAIGIYLITEIEPTKYAIGKWHYARSLVFDIATIFNQKIPEFINLPVKEKEAKILNFLEENNFANYIREGFKAMILEKAQKSEQEKKYYDGALIEI